MAKVVELYEDKAGDFRWRKVDTGNGKILSDSAEGYTRKSFARHAAQEHNPGVPIVEVKDYA